MPTSLATIQPVEGEEPHQKIVESGLAMVDEAAQAGATFICLPERFAVTGLSDLTPEKQVQHGQATLAQAKELAAKYGTVIILPSMEIEDDAVYNTSWIVKPQEVQAYRKAHLTLNERTRKQLTPGADLPVFQFGGVTFGVLTCYDLYFPEATRVLAVKGAEVIFVPSHQRAETAESLTTQVRSRAFDNCIHIVRSAYGHRHDTVWRPGMPAGASSITDCEGRIVRDLGVREGFAVAEMADYPPPRLRSYEGRPDDPRRYLFEDRRPELYQELARVR